VGVIIGLLAFAAGFGVFVNNQLSRWGGVVVLTVAAIAELLMIQSYPFWSLSMFALCILAMYGLIAHGQKISSVKP
jgi:phosphatidylserine synthase